MKQHTSIEALETRIAPAAVFTFTDVDGDAVTVKTSKGSDAELSAIINTASVGDGSQLRKIDFSANAAVFAGTDLIVSVVKKPGGDGLVNIGHIDASTGGGGANIDLGTIVIPGDLGQVDAGDTDSATPAIKSLSVRSLGVLGLSTQGAGDLTSTIRGGVGSIAVKGDIRDAAILLVSNGAGTEALSKIGTLTIGGSLIGGSAMDSGRITTTGDIGSVKIGKDIVGGGGLNSGKISTGGTLKSLAVGGSIIGGSGKDSAAIRSVGSDFTVVKIAHDIVGGSGDSSPFVSFRGPVSSFTVGGSIIGGEGPYDGNVDLIGGGKSGTVKIVGSIVGGKGSDSGVMYSSGSLKSTFVGGSVIGNAEYNSGTLQLADSATITVKGSIVGSTGGGSGSVQFNNAKSVSIGGSIVGGDVSTGSNGRNGYVGGGGKVGSLTIGGSIVGGSASGTGSLTFSGGVYVSSATTILVKGSLIAGEDTSSGTLTNCGYISADEIGSLTILGSVTGSATHRAIISAKGPGSGTTQELAIAKITVGGSVTRADILAGFDFPNSGPGFDGDGSIGSIVVKGDWSASSISAGVKDVMNNGFGNPDEVILPDNNNAAIVSRIASITIGGAVNGSGEMSDHFGFVAQQIGIVKIGGNTIFTGTAAKDPFKELSFVTGDMTIREVS